MSTPLQWPHVSIDLGRRVVRRGDEPDRSLTTTECALLTWLADRPGVVVSRDELLREVWGYAPNVVSRACDNAIQRLRTKLEADPGRPEILVTVHGDGYRLITTATPMSSRPEPPRPAGPVFTSGGRTIDLARGGVVGPDGLTALTGREIEVLAQLYAAGGASVDRDVLQRAVWGSAAGRALEHAISRLRKKVEADPAHPVALVTTARGYRLHLDEAPSPAAPEKRAPPPLPDEVDLRIGRDDAVAAIVAALGRERLVTIVGLGGTGKTRTALACAQGLSARGEAVYWLDLSAVVTGGGLLEAAARAVGVVGSATDLPGAIGAAAGPATFVLDNVEQIDDAATTVVQLLDRARDVRLLVTSRAPLSLRAEHRFDLPPLSHADAVALFLDRSPRPARAEDRPAIDAIVADLREWPLAIELAAARTRVLPFADLARRLSGAGPAVLSTATAPDRPSRHTSVRAALADTFAQLAPTVLSALAQLAVFEGGFVLAHAEAVVTWQQAQGPVPWLPDVLQELIDAQLVRADDTGDRWRLPVVVRDHAAEHLSADARVAAQVRHGVAFAAVGRAFPLAPTPEHWHALTPELANLEAAARRALARGDASVAVGAARGVWAILERRGPFSAAVPLLREVASMARSPADAAWAHVLLGEAQSRSGHFTDAHAAFSQAIERGPSDVECEARARLGRARAASSLGRDTEDDLTVAEALPGFRHRAAFLRGLALARGHAKLVEAADRFEAAAHAAAQQGDLSCEAEARAELASMLWALGSPEADRQHRRALALCDQLDDTAVAGRVHLSRAWDLAARDPAAAIPRLLELADWFSAQGAVAREVWCLLAAANAGLATSQLDVTDVAIQRCERRDTSPVTTIQVQRIRAILLTYRGDPEGGARKLLQLLTDARDRGDAAAQFMIRSELSDVLRRIGRLDEARAHATTALGWIAASGRPLQQAEVLVVLGNIERDAGDRTAAAARYREAIAVAGAPELARVRSKAESALASLA